MESRNVKIVDEHGIDRDAHVICGLKINNLDYVLYSIERDNENDNLFVSKIINNFDGTSNMINIEDSMEKNKLNGIVKELVTYAINNEADKTTGSVKVSGDNEVLINSVMFNKEQNINVPKTYVTTVKKTVTKVSETFYEMPSVAVNSENNESTFFDTVKDDIFSTNVTTPTVETKPVEVVATTDSNSNATVPEPAVVEPVPLAAVPPVLPDVTLSNPSIDAPVSVPNVGNMPVENTSASNVQNLTDEKPMVTSNVDNLQVNGQVANVAPIFDTTPNLEEKAMTSNLDNNLVFDGSKETNLNQALGEASNSNVVSVSDVNTLREFGQDDNSNENVGVVTATNTNSNGGFANKKFFMVIAILFFVAACVFLGYEAFLYFQLRK